MAANSTIEWTDHTFNAWVGCTKLTAACDHCYAESWAKRTGNPQLWTGERRRTAPAYWRQPLKWNAAAEAAGKRARVFCCSLADVFDNQVPPEWRSDLLDLIHKTPHLEWQLLTKRPQNILKMVKPGELPRNAALGTTCENQTQLGLRAPALLAAASQLHPLYTFLSCEPLLGPLDAWLWLDPQRLYRRHVAWVICGGESGPKARPMHPDWARSLRHQCEDAGTPFFFKQWGEFHPSASHDPAQCPISPRTPDAIHVTGKREYMPSEIFGLLGTRAEGWAGMCCVGKKAAGRLLDGREWNGMPEVRA